MQRITVSGLPYQEAVVNTTDASQSLDDLGVTLTQSSTPNDLQAVYVLVSVEDNPVRVSFDTAATTSLGHLFQPGDSFRLENQEIRRAEFISANAGNAASLQITVEY